MYQINLVDILKIDPDKRTVRCEPLVTMGQLTDTLDRFFNDKCPCCKEILFVGWAGRSLLCQSWMT